MITTFARSLIIMCTLTVAAPAFAGDQVFVGLGFRQNPRNAAPVCGLSRVDGGGAPDAVCAEIAKRLCCQKPTKKEAGSHGASTIHQHIVGWWYDCDGAACPEVALDAAASCQE